MKENVECIMYVHIRVTRVFLIRKKSAFKSGLLSRFAVPFKTKTVKDDCFIFFETASKWNFLVTGPVKIL